MSVLVAVAVVVLFFGLNIGFAVYVLDRFRESIHIHHFTKVQFLLLALAPSIKHLRLHALQTLLTLRVGPS